MYCSKIGDKCPFTIKKDNEYIFVIMPFDGFNSIFDVIKQATSNIPNKSFICDRADFQYTNLNIWCDRICKNMRKAKYCIVDITNRNPNVFYELGYVHALGSTKTIIITQNISDAPFDINDLGLMLYDVKDLPKLRDSLISAIKTLEVEAKEDEEIIEIDGWMEKFFFIKEQMEKMIKTAE